MKQKINLHIKSNLDLDLDQKLIQYPIASGETAFQKNKVLK